MMAHALVTFRLGHHLGLFSKSIDLFLIGLDALGCSYS